MATRSTLPRRLVPFHRVAAILALTLAPSAPAQQPAAAPALAGRLDELDRLFAAHVAEGRSPGLSVAVVGDRRIVFTKAYGRRSIGPDLPVLPETRFAIASVSKQFTCACVFLLAEAGKLSVYDPVAKFFPDLARAKDISLLDLMNHTSGYPDYYPLDFVDRQMARPIATDQLIERFAGAGVELDFEPGTAYSYSNTGYIILGRVVEKVAGRPFGDFLKERIFAPLGMDRTLYDPDQDTPGIAKGYVSFALGPPEPNLPEGKGWVGAAGGIYTTAADLARWDIALLEGKVVQPASWALMTRARRLANGSLTGYGCGLGVSTRAGREVLSHGGGVDGFSSWNGMVPSMGAAIVLFCNHSGAAGGLSQQALEILLRDPPAAGPTPVPVIAGAKTETIVGKVFAMLQGGEVDRGLFTADFNDYLTEERIRGASRRLAKYGAPQRVEVRLRRERGGMEVSSTRLSFADASLDVLMYRRRDGTIAQFFVQR